MRMSRLYINGFGIFRDYTLELARGLNVLTGKNEAGKTTLMRFIRAMLFGFEQRNNPSRGEPLRGGIHGGRLTLVQNNQEFEVERKAGTRSAGDVKVYMPDGVVRGEEALESLIGNISPVLFKNVFAFGLDELQYLETLQDQEVSGHIYSAGLGTGRVSLAEVEAELTDRMSKLFLPRGQKWPINKLLKSLRQVENRVRDLQKLPEEYDAAKRELQSLQAQAGKLRRQLAATEKLVANTKKLLAAWPKWEELARKRHRLSDLPAIESFPAAGSERLDELNNQLENIRSERERLQNELNKQKLEREKITVDEDLLDQAHEIDSLSEEKSGLKAELQTFGELKAELASKEQQLEEMLKQLGPDWTQEKVRRTDCSLAVREQTRSFGQQIETARQKAEHLRQQSDLANRSCSDFEKQIEAREKQLDELEKKNGLSFAQRANILEEVQEVSVRLREARQGLAHKNDLLASTKQQLASARSRMTNLPSPLPVWLAPALLAVFMLMGIGSLLFGAILIGGAAIVIGLGISGFFLSVRSSQQRLRKTQEKANQEEVEALEAREAELENSIQELEGQVNSLTDKQKQAFLALLGKESATLEELRELKEELQREREQEAQAASIRADLNDLKQRLQRAREEKEQLQQELTVAKDNLAATEKDWRKWLADRELPALSPTGALEYLTEIERAQEALRGLEAVKHKLTRSQNAIAAYVERVNNIFHQLGETPCTADSVLHVIPRLAAKLQTARQQVEAKQAIAKKIEDLTSRLAEVKTEWANVNEKRRQLLAAGGCEDEELFRQREEQFNQRESIKQEISELEASLSLLAEDEQERSRLEKELQQQDQPGLHHRLDRLQQERNQTEHRLGEIERKIGGLQKDLDRLERSGELSAAFFERNMLQTQLEEKAREWAVLALCRLTLDKAKEKYERERQPSVLQAASHYFAVMTDGRYQQILAPLGEKTLKAVAKDGRRLDPQQLSRGTAEQLYLAMRFALVKEYTRHSVNLPLVMDDIFVNFDPVRLRAALKVLREVADEHQILLFTCHPHVVQAVAKIAPEARVQDIDPLDPNRQQTMVN